MLSRIRGDFLLYSEGLQHGQENTSQAYPPEFRHKVLELARSGGSVAEISRQFDVSRQTIMNWTKQDADSGRRDDILNSSDRVELRRRHPFAHPSRLEFARRSEIARETTASASRNSAKEPTMSPPASRSPWNKRPIKRFHRRRGRTAMISLRQPVSSLG
jgi:transposase-like protein